MDPRVLRKISQGGRAMRIFPTGLLFFGLLAGTSATNAAGFVHDENFTVLAADRSLAAEVLAGANRYRKQVASEWLRLELPPSVGETVIHVTLCDREDRGLTWAIDSPNRSLHKIWLTTSRDRAVGSTLQHEIAHIVLATRHPQRLPAWVEEGVAGSYDEDDRLLVRRQLLEWFAQTGNWPSLDQVFQKPQIVNTDKVSYTLATSVTEFLVSRADQPTFVEFAVAGQQEGWDRALQQFYQIESVADLESAWRTWATIADRDDKPAPRQQAAGSAPVAALPF
jgi:hypothetical protein